MANKPWEVMDTNEFNTYQRNKFMTETKGDPDGKLHRQNEGLRQKYNITSDDYSYNELQMQKAYGNNIYDAAAADSLTAAGKFKSYSDPYAEDIYDAYKEIKNFKYNPENDPTFHAYKDMYRRQGEAAQDKVYSNLTALSGGRNNSWATTAVAQTANQYNQKIADKIPELAERAYNKLLQEYNLLNKQSDKGIAENQAAFDNAMKEYSANADMADRYRAAGEGELKQYYNQKEYELDAEKARLNNIKTEQEIAKNNIELQYLTQHEINKLKKGEMDIEAAKALVEQRRAQAYKAYSR